MSSFYDLTRYFKPKAPGEKNNPLAPPKTLTDVSGTSFNGRVCMYRAISGAVLGTDEPLKILAGIRPLIEFFQVPYDEDIWGPVMAFMFGLPHYKTLESRKAFDEAMSANNEEGVYFISMLAIQNGVSGHAVWAEKDESKAPKFHDNEDPGEGGVGTASLRPKFNDNFRYLVFKKSVRRSQEAERVSGPPGVDPRQACPALDQDPQRLCHRPFREGHDGPHRRPGGRETRQVQDARRVRAVQVKEGTGCVQRPEVRRLDSGGDQVVLELRKAVMTTDRGKGETRDRCTLDPCWLLADLQDPAQVERLSQWVRAWEPRFALERPPRDALLYEPDETLYAIALGTEMAITWNHRTRRIRRGDAIVVPPGLALEVEPEVELLAIRFEGSPPDHFRERFIQVWGYEHFTPTTQAEDSTPGGFREVIPASDTRFPLSYAAGLLSEPADLRRSNALKHGENLEVLINLDPIILVTVGIDSSARAIAVPSHHVLGLGPGLDWQPIGPALLGALRLCSEPFFEARRLLERARLGDRPVRKTLPGRQNPGDRDVRPANPT